MVTGRPEVTAGQGRQRIVFLTLVVMSVLLAACTNPSERVEEEPQLRSEAVTLDPQPADGDSDGTNDQQADGDQASTITQSDIEPTDSFVRLDAATFGNASLEIEIEDAVPFQSDGWLLVGSLVNGQNRTNDAVVAAVSESDPSTNRQVVLPKNGADRASAFGIMAHDDTITVVGTTTTADTPTSVVWTGTNTLDDWEIQELPSSQPDDPQAFEVLGDNSPSYIFGTRFVGGVSQPVVWHFQNQAWGELDVAADPDRNVDVHSGVVVDDRLIAVGRSAPAVGDPKPLVWEESNGELEQRDGLGLPSNGSLYSVILTSDDELLAVGATTDNAISTPLVATAGAIGDRWVVDSPFVDISGWTSFDGLEFAEVAADGDDLYATLTNDVVQQLSKSVDGGATWERQGDLGPVSGNFLPSRGFAINDQARVLVSGGDAAIEWGGTSWTHLGDQQTLPSQRGALTAADIVVGADGFFIGGGKTERADGELAYEAVIWQSPDGISWGRPPLTEPDGFHISDLSADQQGQVAAMKGGGGYFNIASVERPSSNGRWGSLPLPLGETFITDSRSGVSGALIVVGVSPDDEVDRIDPLFAIVETNDTVREIPLTNSPIEEGTNAEVSCLAGDLGNLLAILEWGDDNVGAVGSTNGERWSGLEVSGLNGIDITSCHGDEDGFMVAGQNSQGEGVVATSVDGNRWSVSTVVEPGAVLGIDEIDGEVYLSGWSVRPDGSGVDGTVWRQDGGAWSPLTDSGLASDSFAGTTQIFGLAAKDGIVVAIGADRGRAGAWVATTDALSR